MIIRAGERLSKLKLQLLIKIEFQLFGTTSIMNKNTWLLEKIRMIPFNLKIIYPRGALLEMHLTYAL